MFICSEEVELLPREMMTCPNPLCLPIPSNRQLENSLKKPDQSDSLLHKAERLGDAGMLFFFPDN